MDSIELRSLNQRGRPTGLAAMLVTPRIAALWAAVNVRTSPFWLKGVFKIPRNRFAAVALASRQGFSLAVALASQWLWPFPTISARQYPMDFVMFVVLISFQILNLGVTVMLYFLSASTSMSSFKTSILT